MGRGWNRVTSTNDPTAHAEMIALTQAAATLGSLGPIEHQSFDAWLTVLRVNVAAAMALTRSTLPLLSQVIVFETCTSRCVYEGR